VISYSVRRRNPDFSRQTHADMHQLIEAEVDDDPSAELGLVAPLSSFA
jgi:hypothetical protein